ncbi:hypothetical protein LIER_17985 [Lithospermum erythrorhizon]|uniref:Uncharacterized protein n=1 Tax=Lithospermum erythrorhizon TaxID=34254 RepID=A0AAV3QDM4_LITER
MENDNKQLVHYLKGDYKIPNGLQLIVDDILYLAKHMEIGKDAKTSQPTTTAFFSIPYPTAPPHHPTHICSTPLPPPPLTIQQKQHHQERQPTQTTHLSKPIRG